MAELDIPDELLDQLPELDGGGKRGAKDDDEILDLHPIDAAPAPKRAAPKNAAPPEDLTRVVAALRRDMETTFSKELDRVQNAFQALLGLMNTQLQQATMELNAARAEHERAKAEQIRKAEALRELRRTIEKL